MLASVGPVPAVLLVVAADRGWQPQSEEHLAVLDALRVRHGLLAVTRCDLADPGFWDAGIEIIERHLTATLDAASAAGRLAAS